MPEQRTVVITGANRGIGLELARHFAGEGCDVIGVCREASPELKEVATRVVESCLLYTSPSPRDKRQSRMPSSA